MFCSFYKSILDFVEDTTIQNNLREIVERICSLTLQRIKIENDEELDPSMREETLFVIEDNTSFFPNLRNSQSHKSSNIPAT